MSLLQVYYKFVHEAVQFNKLNKRGLSSLDPMLSSRNWIHPEVVVKNLGVWFDADFLLIMSTVIVRHASFKFVISGG